MRPLLVKEAALIEAMLAATDYADRFVPLDKGLRVVEMNDGGMGSRLFVRDPPSDARFGKRIAQAGYVDADGVYVSITINLDSDGKLFELDMWKVDYSPLKRWPNPEDLRPEPSNK